MAGYSEAVRLVDGTDLRAMLLALRGEARQFGSPDEPEPAFLDLVDRPYESVTAATDRLSRLETRLREREDRRAVFLTIYARMTREVHERIERGWFGDRDWMRRYVVTFANYYRRAFLAFERGNPGGVPDPWLIAFGTAARGDALVVQDAYLGVNAHINYDLALALTDVGIDPHRGQKYADHRAIDEILARLVDVQQDVLARIYASGIDDLDAMFGRLDEAITLRSMTEGREQAWRIATLLTDVGLAPIASYARWVLRATATGGAFFIRKPHLDPALLRRLREIEAEGVSLGTILNRVEHRLDAA